MDSTIQAEEYVREFLQADEIALNDGNNVSLNEETKEMFVDVYERLDEQNKEYFWDQLTESASTFGKLYEFCRTNSSE
jgi:hypothetical protein